MKGTIDSIKPTSGREAYEAWADEVRTLFPGLDIVPQTEQPVAGRMLMKQCGSVKMVRLSSVKTIFIRTPAHIRRSPSEHPSFCWQQAQSLHIAHESGTDELRNGGFVLHHRNRPNRIYVDQPSDLLCVQMPEWRLREMAGISLERWMGALIGFSPSVQRIIKATMLALTDNHQTSDDASVVGDLFLEVVGRGLQAEERFERSASPIMTRRATMLVAFVQARYRIETLSPADAAVELGCSLRLVHATAAALGTTFGRMVREARLRAAMDMLRNAKAERVSEVAFAVGFSDLSHFSRAFRTHFGAPPSRFAARAALNG